jgi:type IV secretory pathway TraG/TraD family ATPase VirD4
LLYEKSEADPFWTDSAIQMLTQIFVAARLENHPLFPYARRIVRLGLPDAAQYLQTVSPEIATQFLGRSFHSVDFENARQLHSTWLTLTSKLQYFLSETVVKSLAVSDFTVSDLMLGDKPVTIYLQWPERYLKAISPLIRLIVGSLIDELVACFDERDGKDCKPVLILADEATRTANTLLSRTRDNSCWQKHIFMGSNSKPEGIRSRVWSR